MFSKKKLNKEGTSLADFLLETLLLDFTLLCLSSCKVSVYNCLCLEHHAAHESSLNIQHTNQIAACVILYSPFLL